VTVFTAVKPLAVAETTAATAVMGEPVGDKVTEACPRESVNELGEESMPMVDEKSTNMSEMGMPYWSRTVAVICDEKPAVMIDELTLSNRFEVAC